MTRSWISDTPDEVEHPPVPLGINEMVVPRISILLSISTVIVILLSSIWIGLDAHKFLNNLEESFESVDESMIEMDGRWAWEVDMLFDTLILERAIGHGLRTYLPRMIYSYIREN